jgi:hypothetical protein
MTKVAVFDFGTSRIKLTIAEILDEQDVKLTKFSSETKAGVLFSDITEMENVKKRMKSAILELDKHIEADDNVYRVSLLTEAFRQFPELISELEGFEEIIGSCNLISGQEEGKLFYSSFKKQYAQNDFVLIDVGGGSVQICYLDKFDNLKVVSKPVGTYKLREHFQANMDFLTFTEAESIGNFIRDSFNDVEEFPSCNNLVFGSNFMENFLTSAMKIADLKFSKSDNVFDIYTLLNQHLLNRNYKDSEKYFLEKPELMGGIDKALIVVLNIANLINAKNIIPTNESVSTSLSKILLSIDEKILFDKKFNLLSFF